MRRLDELHLQQPFYGSRKLTRELQKEGHDVGRRHVVTLMRRMGIEAIYRRPRTSIPAREAAIRPYLLDNLAIDRPNQVWATRHHLLAHGARIFVSGGHHGCRQPQSPGLSALQHPDGGLLCRGTAGSDGQVRRA